jgi:hypothetical protein
MGYDIIKGDLEEVGFDGEWIRLVHGRVRDTLCESSNGFHGTYNVFTS